MPGSLGHLGARFFDYLGSKPLQAGEILEVEELVDAPLQDLFFHQSPRDQRHGHNAMRHAIRTRPGDESLATAALMHDVGKRHAGLGVTGRVVASLLILVRAPMTGRMRAYRDHGALGAEELAMAGAEPLVVDFAKHHHGLRPTTIDEDTWGILQDADRVQRPRRVADVG